MNDLVGISSWLNYFQNIFIMIDNFCSYRFLTSQNNNRIISLLPWAIHWQFNFTSYFVMSYKCSLLFTAKLILCYLINMIYAIRNSETISNVWHLIKRSNLTTMCREQCYQTVANKWFHLIGLSKKRPLWSKAWSRSEKNVLKKYTLPTKLCFWGGGGKP